ncbi:hypothetical protein EMN47_01970 [Prolixibacteraceae bacterium JC049]|nr:hypothetical protein [Prolixibacteraceae bacterium JC049]
MKVYNAEPYGYSSKAKKDWQDAGYEYVEGSWSEVEEEETFKEVEILIVRLKKRVDKNILSKFPKLRMVISATTGVDHVDLNALEENNVKLISLREHKEFIAGIPSTAEHTWALLMSFLRNIPNANQNVRDGEWNRDQYRGWQLKGKIIGIIGYGRTGRKVAKYAEAFDMNVKYYDPFQNDDCEKKVDNLKELFSISDILSFHIHLNDETKHFLNKENCGFIKDNCILINTSRGAIWDEDAVVDLIEKGKIAGIAVDVIDSELNNKNESAIWRAHKKSNNIVITPHIGGATWDAMWGTEEFLCDYVINNN